jgi:hypothetical protein
MKSVGREQHSSKEKEESMTEHNWPTREQYEADQRRYAESMIEYGHNHRDSDDSPGSGFAYDDEAERLKPEIVKTVRRECGRIERQLRRGHPDAAALLRPKDYSAERYDALNPAARDAVHDLWQLRDVRRVLCNSGFYANEYLCGWDQHWPSRHERPTSPELERFFALRARAVQDWRDRNRDRGRRLLADIESGEAWQQQLAHMARVEQWFCDGPVVHRVRRVR